MTDTTTTNPTAPAPPPKTEQAKQKATEVVSSAGRSASEVADQAKGQATEVAATAVDQVAHVMGTARDELRNRASTEAANLGDRLSEIAEELRAMRQASAEHSGVAASLVGGIADQVDRGARRLADGHLESALEDIKRVARNRPGTFLVGAMGLGVLVGRLLRHTDLKEVGQAVRPAPAAEEAPSMGTTNGFGNGYTTELPASPAPDAMATPPAPGTGEAF